MQINGTKWFKYAGNGRSAQETDKAARGGQSRPCSEGGISLKQGVSSAGVVAA